MSQALRPVDVVKRFPVTVGLLAVMAIFFLIEHAIGGGTDPMALLRLGALWADRVSEHGEYFRLFMPLFLHAGWLHLLLNSFALLQLGVLVEYFWGSRRLLLFYVIGGLGASLASAAFNTTMPVSVGGSGAILALAGLILGTSWYGEPPVRDQLLSLVSRQLLFGVLLTFALGFGLWLVMPLVDNWAHIGGFVTGLLIAGAVPDPTQEDRRHSTAGAAAAAAALIASIGWMALEGDRVLDTAHIDLARSTAAQLSENPGFQRSGSAAQMMVQFVQAGAQSEGEDTLARVVARMGDPGELAALAGYLAGLSAQGSDGLQGATRTVAERWLEIAPDDPAAMNFLAWDLVQSPPASRDPTRSVRLARRSLRRVDPEDPSSRAAFLDTLAEGLFQLGEIDEALASQREAVALAQQFPPSLWSRLGLAPSLPLEAMTQRLERIEAASRQG